jgi:hypothetical protein
MLFNAILAVRQKANMVLVRQNYERNLPIDLIILKSQHLYDKQLYK